MMELPPLSTEQIEQLAASNLPPSQLFEILSRYESDACLMAVGCGHPETGGGNPELLSLFYSSFFFAHLLTKQM
jgi:COP9 signalosome complex subunit 8